MVVPRMTPGRKWLAHMGYLPNIVHGAGICAENKLPTYGIIRAMEMVEMLGVRARVARTLPERLRGLIGTRRLPDGEGMLILRCNAIHTFFMSFAIDATFLDRHDRVVKVVRNIRPWHPFVWGGFRAVKVIETASQPKTGD